MTWFYKTKEFTEDDIKDNLGFVYIITNKTNGKMYIGQKKFLFGLRKKKKKSDWQNYFGSCKELLKDVKECGEHNFHREILHLCKKKGEMNWLELKEQVSHDVLSNPNYYNNYCGTRVHRKHILQN